MKQRAQGILRNIVRIIEEKKGENIVVLNLKNISMIADYFVIVSGQSARHVKSLLECVEEETAKYGVKPYRIEGASDNRWVLMDFGEIVVHIFQKDVREYYQIESLWGDAVNVERVY